MIKKLKYKDIEWVDLSSPTESDITNLAKEYKIEALPTKDLLYPTPRSRVEVFENFNYLILHFPIGTKNQIQEIDFIIGRHFLITIHYEEIAALHNFANVLEMNNQIEKSHAKINTGILFLKIIRELYSQAETRLEKLALDLLRVEKDIFAGEQKAMVKRLAEINRDILDYYFTLKTHRQILNSFNEASVVLFGERFTHHIEVAIGSYDKIWNMVEWSRELFTDLRQTNESLLAIKTNDTVKTLTAVAFIFLPFTIIVQIFGMNTILPFNASYAGSITIISISTLASIFAFFLAKYQKWL